MCGPDYSSAYVNEYGKPIRADLSLARDFLGMAKLGTQYKIGS
jgi:hypothetical protein